MGFGFTDPNQVIQQSLGGPGMANNAAAAALGPFFGSLAGSAPIGGAPAVAPQQEQPEFNIEALRKINHPVLQKMVVEMLMRRELQREEIRARQ